MSASDPVVSMVGPGSAPTMMAARALLAGNGVPHRWIDTDSDPVGRLLAEHAGLGVQRTVAVFADGFQLPAPAEFVEPRPVACEQPEELLDSPAFRRAHGFRPLSVSSAR